ncbi:MAG: hypothetical protein HUJ86_03355 [Synergistes sp.]|nr:hypothetical protein [Synergistes sp.]
MSVNIDEFINKEDPEGQLKKIFERYFVSGFGSLSKSDIDLIIFASIFHSLKRKKDGERMSDYEIASELHITVSRVRTLRERLAMKYEPVSDDEVLRYLAAQLKFAKIIKPGDKDSYDNEIKYIQIPIYDITYRRAIENMLEKNNKLENSTPNSKTVEISLNNFFDLYRNEKYSDYSDDEIVKEFKATYKEIFPNGTLTNVEGLDRALFVEDLKKQFCGKTLSVLMNKILPLIAQMALQ